MIILSKEVFNDLESDIALRIRTLVDLTRKTGESDDIVKQNGSSEILTLQLYGKKPDLKDIAFILVKVYTRIDCKD
jgi:hypothetical protein